MVKQRMDNPTARAQWVKDQLQSLKPGLKLLDAGAGERQYHQYCGHLEYTSQDSECYVPDQQGVGLHMPKWNYDSIDIRSDIIAIPRPDQSFDAILCTEVLEHIPDAVPAVKEFSRLLKPGGILLLTAPFCSLTHFAPFHYSTGFSKFYYEHHLPAHGFRIESITPNGNYFDYLRQEILRLPSVAQQYAGVKKRSLKERIMTKLFAKHLSKLSDSDTGSSELLAFGFHVRAVKLD
jgi:ubiquinone/menaquinone biosynthesis C-methylase UbiE